ncbi:MAG TPA: hypothetical protein VMV81_08520 [Phycisphaerae bacterium]|nr:hypothetical protein [Phycisphaerae bacterium]
MHIDIFLAKFDASGNHLWSKRFGDSLSQIGAAIAVDLAGSVWIAGSFLGSLDFRGGPLTSAGASLYLPVDCTGRPLQDCNHDCNVDALDIQCDANEMLNQ